MTERALVLPCICVGLAEREIEIDQVLLAQPIRIARQLLHGGEIGVIGSDLVAVSKVEIEGAAARQERDGFLISGTRLPNASELSQEPAQVTVDIRIVGPERNRLLIMRDRRIRHAALAQQTGEI